MALADGLWVCTVFPHSMKLEGKPVKSDEEIQTYCWSRQHMLPQRSGHCHGKMQTMRSDMYSYAKTIQRISWGALPKGAARDLRQVLARGSEAATRKLHGHRGCFGRDLPNLHLMG